MTKPRFRLTTLLRLRETVRDERRAELAESHRAEAELHRQLTRLRKEQAEIDDRRREAGRPGVVDLERLVETDNYLALLRDRQASVQERRQDVAAETERRREALVEADRDVQSLEKLRERHQRQDRQDAERQETKQLDEAALQMSQRTV
jgi:flagellar protein FliJ